MPKNETLRGFKALERISRVVEEQALPRTTSQESDAEADRLSTTNGLGTTAKPDLLSVQDVIGPDSPYRKIDAETGLEYVDDSPLHITDIDADDLRAELKQRMDKLTSLQGELDNISVAVEKRVKAAGGVDVKVDTKKNVNLRRAIARVYGKKTNVITFDMYKKALELRKRLRRQEVEATMDRKMGEPPC